MTTTLRSQRLLPALAAACLLVGGGMAALAASPEDAVKYRQGVLQGLKWNIGPLAAMAKGEAEFDAAEAQLRAERIAGLAATLVEGFPEGSDMVADTDALPEIWENKADFASKAADLGQAALLLSAAAPTLNGQGELGPLVGQIGQACKACHDEYRAE